MRKWCQALAVTSFEYLPHAQPQILSEIHSRTEYFKINFSKNSAIKSFLSLVSILSKSFVLVHKQILAHIKCLTTINVCSGQRPAMITIPGLSKCQINFQSYLMWLSISHFHLLCSVARCSYNTCDTTSAQPILCFPLGTESF